jgi:hypothetical protein
VLTEGILRFEREFPHEATCLYLPYAKESDGACWHALGDLHRASSGSTEDVKGVTAWQASVIRISPALGIALISMMSVFPIGSERPPPPQCLNSDLMAIINRGIFDVEMLG